MPEPSLETQFNRIATNRLIYERGILVDSIEPAVAQLLAPAMKEALAKARSKLRDVDLTEWQRARYTEYKSWLQKELAAPFKDATPDMKSALEGVAYDQGKVMADILSFGGQATMIRNVGITRATAKSLADTPVGGATLADWIASMGQSMADRVQKQTVAAMLEGQTYRQMVKGLLADTGPIASFSRREAITLARTYTQSVAQRAHDIVMDDNADIVRGRRWTATFDNRACKLCAPLDGRIYSEKPREGEYSIADKPEGPPRHPRCRCLMLPVVNSWMDILGVDESSPKSKKLLGQYKKFNEPEQGFAVVEKYKIGSNKGKVKPVNVGGAGVDVTGTFKGNFESWMKAYPTVAKDILGPRRFELWQSGKVRLNDLLGKGGKLKLLAGLGA
uniref:Putative capsid morphogenesis protein n=1 Tax=viral metagenome TaxID=1070528 RepID=A0A6H1ZT81_9ZZZZ